MQTLRDQLRVAALRALLWTRSQPAAVERALNRLRLPRACAVSGEQVTVAAVQLHADPLPTAAAYAVKMATLVAQAVQQGAQLVVFPEYAGLPLLGLIPGVVERSQNRGAPGSSTSGESDFAVADILAVALPAADRVWRATHSALAARCNIVLMPGTLPQPAPAGAVRPFFNTAFLYGPDGRLLGTQAKLHLTAREVDWACAGAELHVFDVGWGRLAMPVCMDYTYWETARVAGLLGADLLLSPVAEPTAEHVWRQARGVRNRVQETPVYGVQACLVGDLLGETATGATAIYAPLGLLSPTDDTVAACRTVDQEEIVVATLDLRALRRFRQSYPVDSNPALYARYLPAAYRRPFGQPSPP